MKSNLNKKSVSVNDNQNENNEINSNGKMIDNANEKTINSSDNLKVAKSLYISHSVKILIPNLKKEKSNEKEACNNKRETQSDEEKKQENSDNHSLKNNVKNFNILNNVYKNFKIYENQIEWVEEEKINDEDNTDLCLNNVVKQIDSIKINKGMPGIYNEILEGINNLNLLKIRKSYYYIKDIFLKKYYNDQMIKTFLENEFVSEILYRYKIVKKMEALFNINIEDPDGDALNYSIISKKKHHKYTSNYMIDLLDLNGKTRPRKMAIPVNEHSDDCTNNTKEENKNGASCSNLNGSSQSPIPEEDNFKDTKNYENITLLYEQLLCENRKKKEMTSTEEDKHIKNSYIDFDNFQLAYGDKNNSIYYFTTQNEFNDNEKKTNSLKKCNNNNSNNSITKDENKQGDTNTVIYFYLNLTIPSNFSYVSASVTESGVFKLWFPYYTIPFRFGVSACKEIKSRGFGDKIVYTRIAMPWIISDRYILFDTWVCEDLEFSKGIYIYTSSAADNFENIDIGDDISKCEEVNITMYGLILPNTQEETYIKYYIEISPNMHVNEYLISFLTKVFAKRCLSQFITACKNFETNEKYIDEMEKHRAFYDRLKKAAEECKIYN
ncbi:conserved Plasmodium protein, unknown function [Plasmodium chabaudi adami]|uniref:START domain-containing protein n=1 Tax=Plasmodium chabaudi adami TaxID=5826 RepID=A0A1D3RTH0_PLACE|nr:conserved Plasmodium protein, unknown function [Plasmodium chabaudi adami]